MALEKFGAVKAIPYLGDINESLTEPFTFIVRVEYNSV
jgi:hypothetical protein